MESIYEKLALIPCALNHYPVFEDILYEYYLCKYSFYLSFFCVKGIERMCKVSMYCVFSIDKVSFTNYYILHVVLMKIKINQFYFLTSTMYNLSYYIMFF